MRSAGGRSKATIQFGSAALKATVRPEEWAGNLELSHQAMEKVEASLRKPGVKLRGLGKSTPLFRADPADPARLVRTVDGKEERGVFVDGVFQVRA